MDIHVLCKNGCICLEISRQFHLPNLHRQGEVRFQDLKPNETTPAYEISGSQNGDSSEYLTKVCGGFPKALSSAFEFSQLGLLNRSDASKNLQLLLAHEACF